MRTVLSTLADGDFRKAGFAIRRGPSFGGGAKRLRHLTTPRKVSSSRIGTPRSRAFDREAERQSGGLPKSTGKDLPVLIHSSRAIGLQRAKRMCHSILNRWRPLNSFVFNGKRVGLDPEDGPSWLPSCNSSHGSFRGRSRIDSNRCIPWCGQPAPAVELICAPFVPGWTR